MKRICPICQREFSTEKMVDEIIKDFPENKDKWIEMKCPSHDNHFKILREREIAKLSIETKQRILDLMHGGKTVGDVSQMLKLDSMIVAEIICQNIGTIRYLKKEVS